MSSFIYEYGIGNIMENRDILLLVALAGFVLMIAGFAAYVISATSVWISVFAIGIVAVIVPYILLNLENRKMIKDFSDVKANDAIRGYIYWMDGKPSENPATIIDLRDTTRRAPQPDVSADEISDEETRGCEDVQSQP